MALGTIKRDDEHRPGIDFKRRKPSINGLFSLVFWIVAVVIFVMAGMISSRAEGYGDEKIGFMGMASVIFCILGEVLAASGFKEREVSYLFAYIGLGLNSAMLVYLLYLFMYGLF
ncbi:MAG: hypothetical protein MJ124_06445 [Lachnospiraceae bacterium]|nr:hypothetical protein [Lachnospiraceae bacterium]